MIQQRTFTQARIDFERKYNNENQFTCFLTEHLTFNAKNYLKNSDGSNSMQFYKWQFLYSLITSGLFAKDYIGTEIQIPQENSSDNIKLDAAIFDDALWFDKYCDFHTTQSNESLDWLRKHLLVAIEFKKEEYKNIQEAWEKRLKPRICYSKKHFCLGVLYDTDHFFLFLKKDNNLYRFNDSYNTKDNDGEIKDLNFRTPDNYFTMPGFKQLLKYSGEEYSITSPLHL